MSRRHAAEKRDIIPDPKFGNIVVSKFMNAIMHDGKKSVAEGIVYGALEMIEGKTKTNPLNVFQQALDNVMPSIEVRSRRVGGATYQVPMEVAPARQISLATRWIVRFADGRKGLKLADALAQELKDAAAGQGNAIKKRDDTHKMAQANRAFAHFRW